MMNANQARAATAAYRKTTIDNEIKKIKQVVKEATENGKETAYLDGSISVETKRILENLGYKISIHQGRYNEQHTVIDWSGEND